MYEQFYGLHERPFDLTPNPRFLFMTASHRDALATMQYAISGRKGLTMVLGAPGTGKTTLVHAAMARQEGNVRAVYLGNPTLTREEFYEFLAQELGLSTQAQTSKAHFLRELRADLVTRHAEGKMTALVIDEAQAMSDGLFEELRLLENLETPSEKLLPVVLVGQPELAVRLRQPSLLPLRQRVALKCTLSPLSAPEVVGYVSERIRIAGGEVWTVFSPDALEAICQSCDGIPRNISVVCDNALVNGFALDERPVRAEVIAEVCRDFELPAPRVGQPAPPAAMPPVVASPVVPPVVVSPVVPRVGTASFERPASPPADAEVPPPVSADVPRLPADVGPAYLAVREAPESVMTNLIMADGPVVESLMMEAVPRSAEELEKTRTAGLLGKVTGPMRSLRSRFGKAEAR